MGAATPKLNPNLHELISRQVQGLLLGVAPVGKTAASNSIILYTGATGAGKYNYAVPRASGDSGIASIEGIRNSTSYASGTYTVALYKELARFPVTTLGVAAERDFLNQLPSLPRIYDGAALVLPSWFRCSTPANSAFSVDT
jgi:hypothetical protein